MTAPAVKVPKAATKVKASYPFMSIAVEGVIVVAPAATALECLVSFVFFERFMDQSQGPAETTPMADEECRTSRLARTVFEASSVH